MTRESFCRHCERKRSNPLLHLLRDGLLCFARNDGEIRVRDLKRDSAISPHLREFCSSCFAI